jgi:hypothetical protein
VTPRAEKALGTIREGRRRGHRLTRATHAYGVVLILILTSLAFQLAAPDTSGARLVTIVLQCATMLAALGVSGMHRWVFRAAIVVSLIAVLGTAGIFIGSGELGDDAGRSVALLLVAVAPASIAVGVVREIRADHGVTVRAMFGVLCIYLLLGMFFAFLYGVVGSLQDQPFFAQTAAESQSDFLYFSFATITTTGYGDFTAATHLGRSLAITEALIGQIYLVTVVALIVGNLARSRRRGNA